MKFPPLYPGIFVKRNNRFVATVEIHNRVSLAHIANSGRLTDLLRPGVKVWLSAVDDLNRKTSYDLKLVENEDTLVSIDARLPNHLFNEAINNNQFQNFIYPNIQSEVGLGKSRIDFLLSNGDDVCWVETKSVTLVKCGVARFPDAPTTRGQRHLRALADSVKKGDRAAVLFIIQRNDAVSFSPNWEIDPTFSRILREVVEVGVEVFVYKCDVNTKKISIAESKPLTFNF